jgi:hypothetical protein
MPIITKEQLKSHIHSIHDYIRNSGAGYSMTAMKIFVFFYGLKIIEPHLKRLKLKITPFSKLVKLAKENNGLKILNKIIDRDNKTGIMFDLNKLKDSDQSLYDVIFYYIPEDMQTDFYVNIVKLVDQIPTANQIYFESEQNEIYDVDFSGKLYEYFIGRDHTAISELGAYFTDRHITSYIIGKIKPSLIKSKLFIYIYIHLLYFYYYYI